MRAHKRWTVASFFICILILGAGRQAQSTPCTWKAYGTPSYLFSISAIAPNDIFAAGGDSPAGSTSLVHWDGSGWSTILVPSNNGPTANDTVSATADNDVWVASSYVDATGNLQPYVIHYDGTQWSQALLPPQQPDAPRYLLLQAFSPSDAWVVEYIGDSTSGSYVSLHWNGSSWKSIAFREPIVRGQATNVFEINAIGGMSGKDLWAVGRVPGVRPLFEHFDGRRWSIVREPALSGPADDINAVYSVSPSDAWAVGDMVSQKIQNRFGPVTRTFAAHWNGQTWSAVATPNFDWPSSHLNNTLHGVAGSGSNDVWAVGDAGVHVGQLALHWDGHAWSISERPPKMGQGYLSAVADLGQDDVWAVGTDADFWCSH